MNADGCAFSICGGGRTIVFLVVAAVKLSLSADPRCPSSFGLFADSSACGRYISCWGGRGYSLSCGSNMVFNPETLSCQGGVLCPKVNVGAPLSGEKVRLMKSRQLGSGQVHVLEAGEWGLVLASSFSDAAASLVCERLGYKGFDSWFSALVQKQNKFFLRLSCPVGSKSIENCSSRRCSNCNNQEQAVILRCKTESSSRCPESSDLWRRWGDHCYLAKDDVTLSRNQAKAACQALRGDLVSIDEQMEHEFLSTLLNGMTQGEYYTDGVSTSATPSRLDWVWETTQFPVKYHRWWAGWNSTGKPATPYLPSPMPSAACVVLKNSFPLHPRGARRKFVVGSQQVSAEYDSGFFFFHAADCDKPRPFICKTRLKNFGCRQGIGSDYSGPANVTQTKRPCLHWTDPSINNLMGRAVHARASTRVFDMTLLGDHNYCRNPNNSPRPWCFVDAERTEDCDIPYCDSNLVAVQNEHPLGFLPVTEKDKVVESLQIHSKTELLPTLTENAKVRCKSSEYHCERASVCIGESQVCDGTRQCPRGDDERGCKTYLNSFDALPSFTLIIRNLIQTLYREDIGVCAKKCLDDARCKGIIYDDRKRECGLSRISVGDSGLIPSSHEDVYEVSSRKKFCGSLFKCSNGRCVSKSLSCNGKNDCGDNSDESNCSSDSQYRLRLTGGKSLHEGNVQIQIQNQWGYICDDGFGWNEADLVCRELGFSGASKFTRNNAFGNYTKSWLRSSPRFWLSNLRCSTKDLSILQCSSKGAGYHGCGPTEIAGVICRRENEDCAPNQFQCNEKRTCIPRTHVCNNNMNCPDSSDEDPKLCDDYRVVKLLPTDKIPGHSSGTVLVKHRGAWGSVCDDGFEEKHAQVVCRGLGYDSAWATAYSKAHLGQGTGGVLIDDPGCRGFENHLSECPTHSWGPGNCDHTEDVGVFCSEEAQIRLVAGKSSNSGRVEILLGGVWGTICDDDFDDYDAKVVCNMLGYRGGGIAHKKGTFGKGSGPVWLDNLDCLGSEASVSQCKRSPVGTSACSHAEDVGVTCFESDPSKSFDHNLKSKLPGTCGSQSNSFGSFLFDNLAKIIGGRTVRRFDSPWLVSLQLREKGIQKHNCGGVVISEDLVLTAAHCFRSHSKNAYVVRVGDFDLETHEPTQEDFQIEKLFVHEDFDTKVEFNNDFAVLKLSKRRGRGIRLGDSIRPVCLPPSNADYFKATNCKITGWGTTNEQADPIPERKPRSGKVNLFPMSTCLGETGYADHEITSGMVCAGQLDGSVDTCTGDSGGPLTCEVNGRQVLFGITSWGKGCGRRGQPGMYTKVTKYLRWLGSIIP